MAIVGHTHIVHTLNTIARDSATALSALKHDEGESVGEHVAAVAALLCSTGLPAAEEPCRLARRGVGRGATA